MSDRYQMTDTQKAARQAAQVGEAERKADSMLTPGLGEAMAMDRVEGTQADMMPDEPEMRTPASNPEGVEGPADPAVGSPLSQEGFEAPFDTQKGDMRFNPGDVQRFRADNAEFLTRDREGMEDFPSMGREELQEARNRLMAQLRNEGPGTQRDAFVVLLNRIERALGKSGGEE